MIGQLVIDKTIFRFDKYKALSLVEVVNDNDFPLSFWIDRMFICIPEWHKGHVLSFSTYKNAINAVVSIFIDNSDLKFVFIVLPSLSNI